MKKEEKKPQYILCPRCELNYINKKDKLCNVCKAEIGLIDSSILIPDEEEVGEEKLCPICHVNYIGEDEEICFTCAKEREEKEHAEKKESENWDYDEETTIEQPDDDMEIPLSELMEDEEEAEEESEYKEPDDFDYDVDPNDFIADDDEEDEEDDDYDDF